MSQLDQSSTDARRRAGFGGIVATLAALLTLFVVQPALGALSGPDAPPASLLPKRSAPTPAPTRVVPTAPRRSSTPSVSRPPRSTRSSGSTRTVTPRRATPSAAPRRTARPAKSPAKPAKTAKPARTAKPAKAPTVTIAGAKDDKTKGSTGSKGNSGVQPAVLPTPEGSSLPGILAMVLLALATLVAGTLAMLPRVPAARGLVTRGQMMTLARHRYELTALAAIGVATLLLLVVLS